jgi:fatty acid desaturase
MNMGLPQIIYKYHHLNHHRFNNSLEDPSSTFLYGKNGQQEHHISPQEHWTKRPEVSEKFQEQMNSAGTYKSRMPPLLGMLE